MKLIIDRIEENFAVCEKENREMIHIPISDLPKAAKDGDCLILSDGKYKIDLELTLQRKTMIEKKFRQLKGN